jgi:hypothetical protein
LLRRPRRTEACSGKLIRHDRATALSLPTFVSPKTDATHASNDLGSRTRRKPRLVGGVPDTQPPARASRMKSVT